MQPQGPPTGGVGGGAPPQMGGPVPQQMTIDQLASRIRSANPDITPQVMASAIGKALPLLNAQSQMDWKTFQASTQYERLMQARQRETDLQTYREGTLGARKEGAEEKKREYDTSEKRRQDALDFRKDTKATELRNAAERLKNQAAGLDARKEATKTAYNAYDKYMRGKIQAEQSLSGAEKKQALSELDAGWAQFHRDMEDFDKQFPQGGGQPGLPTQGFKDRFGGQPGAPPAQSQGGGPQVGDVATSPGKPPLKWDGQSWVPVQ